MTMDKDITAYSTSTGSILVKRYYSDGSSTMTEFDPGDPRLSVFSIPAAIEYARENWSD